MAEWIGAVATTITKYFRGETDEVLRNYKLLAILNDRGLITFNNSGIQMQWQARFAQAVMQGYDDSDTITFSRLNRHKDAVLPWRGYIASDAMTERERLMNSGVEAIVKVFSNKANWLMEDIQENLGVEFYVDGNGSGNSKRFHGIESFMGFSGTVSGSPVGSPHDTYAALNTDLGSYGGTWSGNWPTGTGSPTYDFWSPTIVDYTNTFWPQTTKTWANTCIDALRYGIMATQKNKSKKKAMDLILLERELYRPFLSLLQVEERINISPSEGSSGLYKLGFKDMQNFDGVDVSWEYGVPAATGYGWCMNDVELMSLQGELIQAKGPTFDESSQAWRFWANILANLKFEGIRNFAAWKAIS